MKQCVSIYDGTLNIKDLDQPEVSDDAVQASKIITDSTHRFVTDEQITLWNAKASSILASTSTNGLMSKEDKIKLDGIDTTKIANKATLKEKTIEFTNSTKPNEVLFSIDLSSLFTV